MLGVHACNVHFSESSVSMHCPLFIKAFIGFLPKNTYYFVIKQHVAIDICFFFIQCWNVTSMLSIKGLQISLSSGPCSPDPFLQLDWSAVPRGERMSHPTGSALEVDVLCGMWYLGQFNFVVSICPQHWGCYNAPGSGGVCIPDTLGVEKLGHGRLYVIARAYWGPTLIKLTPIEILPHGFCYSWQQTLPYY